MSPSMIGSWAAVLATVAMAAAAHLMLKAGMNDVGRVGAEQLREPVRLLASLLTTPMILVAVPVYVGSFVAWIIVLSRLQLSLAYPVLALNYVLIPLAAWALLHEPISAGHWVGIMVTVVGVTLVVRAGLS